MKIQKLYTFTNKKQIWRLLPTNTDKLVIEERDPNSKEAFFSCIEINSGEKIFNKLIIEEKFWIGIEKVYNDIIFFHKYSKPDMPGHKGIFAYDILSKKILWKNEDSVFLFIIEDDLYSYKETPLGKNYIKLNYKTGEQSESKLSEEEISLKQKAVQENYEGYHFTRPFSPETENNNTVKKIFDELKINKIISGKIDIILFKNLLLYSFHEIMPEGTGMKNQFEAVDIGKGKVIFVEELNKGVKNFIPDSFFIKDNKLFLLKEKTELVVCSII